MNAIAEKPDTRLTKPDPGVPALAVTGRDGIIIRAGTFFAGWTYDKDWPVPMPAEGLIPGTDYVVMAEGGNATAVQLSGPPSDERILGGFHFAPGGNATGRSGGDETPAINPHALWDLTFRPACPDPRGMTHVDAAGGRFWCDIYLLGVAHLADGTSRLGATIADGNDPPEDPAGGLFRKLDYDTAKAVVAHHGKQLLSVTEFFAAAFGVTERTACGRDPKRTDLDAPRTSAWGLMQATGNMWVWGHDGDPDDPRASVFGGSWLYVDSAGSRQASVDHWPDFSDDGIGVRGRCDHLQPE